MKKRGIVIIAAGHPVYGTWALNLCMSIKVHEPDVKVCLLHYGTAINHIVTYKYMFDEWKEIPDQCMNSNGLESLVRSKVCLYELSPFDETIFIDADVVVFPSKKISTLFEEMQPHEFAMGSRGIAQENDRFKWTSVDRLKEQHKHSGEVYNLSSEFIYWKKGKVAKKIFAEAKKAYDDPGTDYIRFAHGVPDELAFQIAYIKTGHAPHKEVFLPFYWAHLEEKNKPHLPAHELYKTEYYGYSMGGNVQHTHVMDVYNNIAKWLANQFGLRHHYPMQNKREVITARHTI